jgi:hypothetical protein
VDKFHDFLTLFMFYTIFKHVDGKFTAIVGTLNQGYPLLQYEDAAPMRRLQAKWRTAPDPTAWAGQRAPRGKKRQHIPVCIVGSGPPQKDAGPLYV